MRTLSYDAADELIDVLGVILDNDEVLNVEQLIARLVKLNPRWNKPAAIDELTRRRNANPIPHRKFRGRRIFIWREVLDWWDAMPGVKPDEKGDRQCISTKEERAAATTSSCVAAAGNI